MFEAAVSKFVKSVGKESLVPVPNLDEANQCHPLQVVVKKNRRWLWQSAKYETTPFQLSQLLTDKQDLLKDKPVTSRKLTTYNKTYKFNISGKLGGKLKSLLDAELSGSDSVQVEAKFGDITKVEVDEPSLMDELDNRKLNLEHDFIQQIRANDRKVVCVIVGVAQTASAGSVHMHTEEKGTEELDLAGIGGKAIGEDENGSVDNDNDKKLAIPAGTPLAYNLCELYVRTNGQLELMLESEAAGGWEAGLDEADGELEKILAKDVSLSDQMRPLLQMSDHDRDSLRHNVLQMCTKPLDIQTFLHLLKMAMSNDPTLSTYTMNDFLDPEPARLLLDLVNLKVKDSNVGLEVPPSESPRLDALRCLFEAIMELDDDETVAMAKVSGVYTNGVITLLQTLLDGEQTITTHDVSVRHIYAEPNLAQAFLAELGLQMDEEAHILPSGDNYRELEGAYRAMYTLWYDPQEEATSHHMSWCNVI